MTRGSFFDNKLKIIITGLATDSELDAASSPIPPPMDDTDNQAPPSANLSLKKVNGLPAEPCPAGESSDENSQQRSSSRTELAVCILVFML